MLAHVFPDCKRVFLILCKMPFLLLIYELNPKQFQNPELLCLFPYLTQQAPHSRIRDLTIQCHGYFLNSIFCHQIHSINLDSV